MTLEERKARIDLLKAREAYEADQKLRAKVTPGTAEARAITKRQNARIIKMQELDCLINQRPRCN